MSHPTQKQSAINSLVHKAVSESIYKQSSTFRNKPYKRTDIEHRGVSIVFQG